MARGRGTGASLTLVALLAQLIGPGAAARPSAAPPSAHQVYVAVITGHGDQVMDTSEINAAIDAGLEDWAAQLPAAFSSFARVTTVELDSSATPNGESMCSLFARRSPMTDAATDQAWAAMQAEGQALFGVAAGTPGVHVVYVLPPRCAADAVGLATLGTDARSGGFAAVSAGWNAGLRGVLVHELGHHFGLGHADATCSSGAVSCGVIEYGDCYAPMGNNVGSVASTAERVILGAVEPGEVQTVEAGDVALQTQLRLAPRGARAGLRGAAVTDPETGDVTYLDYRSHTGLDDDAEYGKASFCPSGVTATRIQSEATLLIRRGEPSVGAAVAGETIPIGRYASATVLSADGDGGALLEVRVAPPPGFDRLGRVILGHKRGRWVTTQFTRRFDPVPGALKYAWYVEDATGTHPLEPTPKAGVSGPTTWVPPTAARVWVVVTATRRGRALATAASQPASLSSIRAALSPRLRGKPSVGRSLTVVLRRAASHPPSYTWYADGRRLRGADAPVLRLTPDLVGTEIKVVVVARHGAHRERTVCYASRRVRAR